MSTEPCPPHRTAQIAIVKISCRSCSAALPVRGSSKPSQHSIKRSKTISRAANRPQPGRIHLAQNRKSRLTRPKKSKCDSPADLNPVAVLIGKALVEIPPKFAGWTPVNPKSQAELKRGGKWNGKGA